VLSTPSSDTLFLSSRRAGAACAAAAAVAAAGRGAVAEQVEAVPAAALLCGRGLGERGAGADQRCGGVPGPRPGRRLRLGVLGDGVPLVGHPVPLGAGVAQLAVAPVGQGPAAGHHHEAQAEDQGQGKTGAEDRQHVEGRDVVAEDRHAVRRSAGEVVGDHEPGERSGGRHQEETQQNHDLHLFRRFHPYTRTKRTQ
jgi:hypothetical protein